MRLLQYNLVLGLAALGAAYPVAEFPNVAPRSDFDLSGLMDLFHENLSDDVLNDLSHLKDMFNEAVAQKNSLGKRADETSAATLDWNGLFNLFGGSSTDGGVASPTTSSLSLIVGSVISEATEAAASITSAAGDAATDALLYPLFPSSSSTDVLLYPLFPSSSTEEEQPAASSTTTSGGSGVGSLLDDLFGGSSNSSSRSSSRTSSRSSTSTSSRSTGTSTPFSLSNITSINANTSSSTFDSLLLYANSSGIIWTLLDEVADSPRLVSSAANYTAGLIGNVLANPPNLTSIYTAASNSKINITALADPLLESGLLTSLADGLLLDDNFRPRLAELVNRAVRANTPLLEWVVHDLLAPPKNKKRDLFSGTLTTFISNFAGSFINSQLFLGVFGDVVNSLNDTGVAVYVVKHLLEEDKYVNVTGDFFEQVMNSPRVDWSDVKNFNVKGLLNQALSDPAAIFETLGKVLNGGSSKHVFAAFSKYFGAAKELVLAIEADGLFDYLNKQLFSTTLATLTATSDSNKRIANPLVFKEVTIGNSTITVLETASASTIVDVSATATEDVSTSAMTPSVAVLSTVTNAAGGVLAISAFAIGLQVLLVMLT